MESMEFNKICASVLTAGIAFSALGIISDELSHPKPLKESVLKIKGTESAPAAGGPATRESRSLRRRGLHEENLHRLP
jgi:hypothetical protein